MACDFEVAVNIEGHTYDFLGSHIVIDLHAARWTIAELNKLWLDSKMDVAPLAMGLSRSRTTEQDVSWLIVGVKLEEPRHWPANACPPISGVPEDLRRQALSV
jgi:hypothetical protein